ncbi:hypothetical protein ABTZ03_08230 [Kitasatospora sp. NPDC096077]|uniref:hypothetical protein n=1 Tax=Kitasatospora sp. NPDC096077 TaxID=3155544 RepID=UPI003323BEDB
MEAVGSREVPEAASGTALGRMLAAGGVTPPAESGMPELAPDLLPDVDSLSDLLIEDRRGVSGRR